MTDVIHQFLFQTICVAETQTKPYLSKIYILEQIETITKEKARDIQQKEKKKKRT